MFRPCFAGILLVCGMFRGAAEAHAVPTLVVEAEFTSQRTATFKVNLDPRLFLAIPPTSLPPVPASWWFDQDANSQAEVRKKAGDCIDRLLAFKIGNTPLKGAWQISPIDSDSAAPLETGSAEMHLLAERTGLLPVVDGPFTLEVNRDCPVGLILVNSLDSLDRRRPQSLFAGETSVGFPLPAVQPPAEAKPPPFICLAILALPLLLAVLWLWKRKKQPRTLSH